MQKMVVANWKMYKTRAEAEEFVTALRAVPLPPDVAVLLAPSFPLLPTVAAAVSGSAIGLAAQNMYYAAEGAFTGEVSAAQLGDVGCQYVLIGHSERRYIFGEDNALLQKKIQAALHAGLTPIYCVGETATEHAAEHTSRVITQQLTDGLDGLTAADRQRIVVAYEPVWAIGTGNTATPAQAEAVHQLIKQQLAADSCVLYGGSVKRDTAAQLLQQPSVNGLLVGSASLDVAHFAAIITA